MNNEIITRSMHGHFIIGEGSFMLRLIDHEYSREYFIKFNDSENAVKLGLHFCNHAPYFVGVGEIEFPEMEIVCQLFWEQSI